MLRPGAGPIAQRVWWEDHDTLACPQTGPHFRDAASNVSDVDAPAYRATILQQEHVPAIPFAHQRTRRSRQHSPRPDHDAGVETIPVSESAPVR